MKANNEWWYGPRWLNEVNTEINSYLYLSIDDDVVASQNSVAFLSEEKLDSEDKPNCSGSSEFPIEVTSFCTFDKLIQTVAMILMYIYLLINKLGKGIKISRLICMEKAKFILIKNCQKSCFTLEYTFLQQKSNGKIPNLVKQLDLYLDEDDLIRCKGRLQFPCLPKNSAFPILLPYI